MIRVGQDCRPRLDGLGEPWAQAHGPIHQCVARLTMHELSRVASWAHDPEAQSMYELPWFDVVAE